jgi:DNA helicase IV
MLYGRLDDLRDRASGRLSKVLLETGGTPAARSERDAFVEMYSQRITQLDAAENGLCFGRLDLSEGERRYIGRIGILDDSADYEALLVDWRAPAARPFYIATAFSPEGVLRRRHIRTRQRKVTGVDDEVLDLAAGEDGADRENQAGLTGEAALIAALSASRTGRMTDIVETIQAEQDMIIRSPHNGVTVVQGAPGTGKTAVALHRAAYLLYTYRQQLSRRGVLIVGPNPTFLRYIGHVLPSLGETGVLMSTISDLFPGISARRAESPEAAEVKGRQAMAAVLAAAVRDRQQVPAEPLEITFERQVLQLDRKTCQRARDLARRSRRPHNQARPIFVREIIDALVQQITAKLTAGLREADKLVAEALGEEMPAESNTLGVADTEDIRAELRQDSQVQAAIAQLWPVLTPQRLLDGLFASPRRLASAAPTLSEEERALLRRDPRGGWTPADVPLLDEAAELLGEDDRAARRRAKRQRQEEIAYAQGVLDIVSRDLEDDPEILMAYDLLNADRLAGRQEELNGLTTAERAAADRTWAFGHIVVDEAQELSEMAWRMLMRRCPSRSMTIAGDIAQASSLSSTSSWERVLAPHLGTRWRLDRLTINYRTPAEIMTVAADVLAEIDDKLDMPTSVRETGTVPWRWQVPADELAARVAAAATEEAAEVVGGNVAVLVPATRLAEISHAVAAARPARYDPDSPSGERPESADPGGPGSHAGAGDPANGDPANGDPAAGDPEAEAESETEESLDLDDPDLDTPVVVLTVSQAKGLEFDSVLIADPAQILAESPRGLSDLYIALTRATQRLGVVHPGPLPEVLRKLEPLPG